MAPSTELKNRRAVRGTAYRPCEYCGRSKKDSEGRPMNYQYRNTDSLSTDDWDTNVYCSKVCRQAWRSINP